MDIKVLQGERQFARDNKLIGNFRLKGIKPAPAGVPQIEVTFDIDANGIVQVSAKDLGTGKHQEITITASSNLSDSEIEQAIREAQEYEATDGQRKAYIDARSEADTLVRQVENVMADKEKERLWTAHRKECEIVTFICEEAYFKDKARKCERRAGCRDKACGR